MKFIVTIHIILLILLATACAPVTSNGTPEKTFNINTELKTSIALRGKQWSVGLKTKDGNVFAALYDTAAIYLPDAFPAIRGNQAIADYWVESFPFIRDLHLNMESLEGTEDLLYESGTGIAILATETSSNDTLHYKYLNIWKKQSDGSYRVAVDMYNDIGR